MMQKQKPQIVIQTQMRVAPALQVARLAPIAQGVRTVLQEEPAGFVQEALRGEVFILHPIRLVPAKRRRKACLQVAILIIP